MRFRLFTLIGVAVLVLAAGARPGAQTGQYVKAGEIHIGGAGRFDYLNVDSEAKRLYVTHGTEIVVIDLTTNAIVGRIPDTPRVHGIAFAPGGRGFTTNGGENKVGIIDLKSLQLLGKVDTGANPDAVFYDAKQKEIWAVNHSTTSATVIDAATGKVAATVTLSGAGESGQADPSFGPRVHQHRGQKRGRCDRRHDPQTDRDLAGGAGEVADRHGDRRGRASTVRRRRPVGGDDGCLQRQGCRERADLQRHGRHVVRLRYAHGLRLLQ